MRKAIIHIGVEKTGTSSIQKFMAMNHEPLLEHGIYALRPAVGEDNNRILATYCLSEKYNDEHIINLGLTDPQLRQEWRDQIRDDFNAEIEALPDDIHTVIISSEHFHSRVSSEEDAAKLLELLKPHFDDIKIIVYLRRQDEVAVSLYSTACRVGIVSDIMPEMVEHYREFYFNYHGLLERWSKVFGKENLVIRVFDKNRFFNSDLVDDFLHSSGLYRDDYGRLEKPRVNERLSATAQEAVMCFNRVMHEYNDTEISDAITFVRGKLIEQYNDPNEPSSLPTRKEVMEFYSQFQDTNSRIEKEYLGGKELFNDDFAMYPEERKQILDPELFNKVFIVFRDTVVQFYGKQDGNVTRSYTGITGIIFFFRRVVNFIKRKLLS